VRKLFGILSTKLCDLFRALWQVAEVGIGNIELKRLLEDLDGKRGSLIANITEFLV
jgi:hypothetical protein